MSKLRCLALIVSLALIGVACGDGGPPVGAVRQELTVGYVADPLDKDKLGNGLNIAEPLLMLTPEYEVEPMLAERWELRPPNTWRFHLRKGVSFHDGQPMNAQAVKEGLFDRVAKVLGGGTIKAGPDSAVVVDEHTIDFTPTTPNLRVPEQIVHPNNSVFAPGSDPGKKPVGTGPFRFVEYRPKERLVVERNPDYWGREPTLERITFRFYPDDQSRRLALEAGDVQLAINVPRTDVKGLKGRGFKVVSSTAGSYEAMYLNVRGTAPHDILRDVDVRRAVAAAIDRRALVQGVLDGQATEDATFVPPNSLGPYASLVSGIRYDREAARKLLADAGWRVGPDGFRAKDGRKLELTLVSGFPSASAHQDIPAFLQSQLKEVGIDVVVVERPDPGSYTELIEKNKGDMFLEQGHQNDANPALLPFLLFSKANSCPPPCEEAAYQQLFAPGGRFDELIVPTLSEPHLDEVRRATAEALQELIDRQAVVVPLAGIFRIYSMSRSVQGFVPHPSVINLQWNEISMATGR